MPLRRDRHRRRSVEFIAALAVALIAFSVSRTAVAQRADTVRLPSPVILPIFADTAQRLFGGQNVPRSLGVSMGILDSAAIASSGARTLAELLNGRVAGVGVLKSSGVVGAGSRVRLRGASSLYAPREPIVVLDGARVDATQDAAGLSRGGQQPSRLDDIDLDQVERVEILRGPAASALYGTDGAGGVIRLTTRRPRRQRLTLHTYAEGGMAADATTYPDNYSTGSGITGQNSCTQAEAAARECTPGPVLKWNPLEHASPFRTATRSAAGADASGGSRWLGYAAGASARHEQGTLAPNVMNRYTGRLNLNADVLQSVVLALRTSYVASRVTSPFGNGEIPAMMIAGVTGNAIDDSVNRGYRSSELPVPRDVPPKERVKRAIGSLTASWTPASWLTARAVVGGESLRRDDHQASGIGQGPTRDDFTAVLSSLQRDTRSTVGGSVTSAFHVTRSITSETVVGMERLTHSMHAVDSRAIGVPPASQSKVEVRQESRVTGLIASQRLAWVDRRYLGAGVRRDRQSLTSYDPSTSWSVDAAWVIGEEPFFPRSPALSNLRLRAALGRSVDFRTYGAVPESGFPPPAFVTASPLTGETISEGEIGVDASWFDRVWTETTWYRQWSKDALVMSCCSGIPPDPIGAWHATGLDLTLTAALVRSLRIDWTARVSASVMSNRVDGLGLNGLSRSVGPVSLPFVRLRNTIGRPIAGVWASSMRVHDDNGDGTVTRNEIDLATDATYQGSSSPTRELGLSSTLALRRFAINALLDYHGGFKQLNSTEEFRCDLEICRAQYDSKASLRDQARAVAVSESSTGFIENGSFLRLRELGVTWRLLPGWAYRHGFDRLDLTVSGRNLLTWTGYSGFDPEVNSSGQAKLGMADFLTLPLPRTVSVRFDVQR